jgi:hypothetical protein
MTISTTTSSLTNALRTQYEAAYRMGVDPARLYDQFALPYGKDMANLTKGSSVQINYMSDLVATTQTISETVDVTPVVFDDATHAITPTSRGNAIKVSEKMLDQAYTDANAQYYGKVGLNMQESVDLIARDAALQGTLVKRTAARNNLDAGTTTDYLVDGTFIFASSVLAAAHAPMFRTWEGMRGICLTSQFAWADYTSKSSTLWQSVGTYQNGSMILNNEVGSVHGFKVIASPDAKIFYAGAGTAHATAGLFDTTLSSASVPLATTIVVGAATSMDAGDLFSIGTEETGDTHYADNEWAFVAAVSGTTITVTGMGANGGLRFAHAAGARVTNDDWVGTAVFGGPGSLGKIYDTNTGEFGTIVGPKRDGLLEQWMNLGWKWYGAYDRPAESSLIRAEVSLSVNA